MKFSGPSDGTDATPAFNASIAALIASPTDRTLHFPAEKFTFLTAPAPMAAAINIKGNDTRLLRAYSGPTFLQWQRGTDQSGGSIEGCEILTVGGAIGGIGIYVMATADTDGAVNSFNRHNFRIVDVLIGRGDAASSWAEGIFLDGMRNPDGNPNSVPGIRGVWIDRTTVASFTVAGLYLYTARGVDASLNCYNPLGANYFVGVDGNSQDVSIVSRDILRSNLSYIDSASTGLTLNFQPVNR